MRAAVQDIAVCGIAFEREQSGDGGAVIEIGAALRVSIEDCAARSLEPALVVGVAVQDARQLRLARSQIEMVQSGVWITGKDNSALTIVDNYLSLQPGAAGQPAFGVLAQQVSSMLRVEGNAIDGGLDGILVNDTIGAAPSSFAQRAEIIGNWIRTVAPAAGAALAPPAFGIDSAADASNVSGNLVLLPGGATGVETGLRLTGSGLQATGNDVLLVGDAGAIPMVGIQLGFSTAAATVPTGDAVIGGNTVTGCSGGIVAAAVNGADISANLLEAGGARAGTSLGIALTGCIGLGVHDNRVVGFAMAISSGTGIANRIAGNIIAGGNFGVTLVQETTPVVTQNRITDMARAAIAGIDLFARCDVTENRIAACGYGTAGSGSILVVLALGELRIAGNEIIDTGVSLAGASVAPAYGIGAIWALEATVEGNQVTYTDVGKRDVTAEDRALLIGGLIESTVTLGEGQVTIGFPIQVLGNKFTGAGRSALVELVESQVSDLVFRRFERVIFSNNYCAHAIDPAIFAPPPAGNATVRLKGRAASVLGNQVKAARGFPSFDFNNMPGPFMGNVASGSVTRHTDLPAPISAYNLTF